MEEKSIYEQFKATADEFPHNLCMRFEDKTWSYASVDKSIEKTAAKLLTLGIKEKEVVSVSLPNCPEALYLFYAISRIGAISYNIHPLTPPEMLKTLLTRSGSTILFCLSLNAAADRKALDKSIRVLSINPYQGVKPLKGFAVARMSKRCHGIKNFYHVRPQKELPAFKVDPKEDALYLNTGGTNGEPKIVRLSSNAINNLANRGYPLVGGKKENIKILTAIPLFHGFGLTMGVHTPLSFGGSTVLMLKFNTKEAIDHIKKANCTVLLGVPALYNALLSKDSFYGPWLQKQITAFIGGDSVPQSLLDRWNNAMEENDSTARLFEGYGLTETMTVTNVNCYCSYKRGTIGKPLPGIKELIVDPKDGKILPRNVPGEIYVSSDTLMNGYLHDEKQEAFKTIDGVKYLATKDYGFIDDDGFLIFKQRLKRVEKINGETLCPSDVEQVALDDRRIYEAFCYGVKDERKGHVFRLVIVLRRGDHPANKDEVIKDIYADLEQKLTANYKPDKIIVSDKLPRTPIGKIDSNAIIKEYGE
ncbi:MAG: acyl--CoA ligase [Bacilli bacterium]|jgi:long-chain acyl-CoA synthetase|nr:acyl--CoA ligase [Bacilli bacterium]MCH4228516.1 acyl--CoA ligase [Bacilli bacterium]MCH4277798.1 acyl--CoA ligase [Bacilli bacterium]MCI2054968.1 acyl--CoA ligase [Bacilli bacterium]